MRRRLLPLLLILAAGVARAGDDLGSAREAARLPLAVDRAQLQLMVDTVSKLSSP